MKQVITEKQFNELKDEQKTIWYQFCREHKYVTYDNGGDDFQVKDFPSIGEMLSFLEKECRFDLHLLNRDHLSHKWLLTYTTKESVFRNDSELCDSLWEEVKRVLKIKKRFTREKV